MRPKIFCIRTLSRNSRSIMTCGSRYDPKAAVAIKQPPPPPPSVLITTSELPLLNSLNVAETDVASVTETVHEPVPEQAPDQPAKVLPESGVASRVTCVAVE